MGRGSAGNQSGSSLVKMLIALGILSAAVIGGLAQQLTAVHAQQAASRQHLALFVLSGIMEQLRIDEYTALEDWRRYVAEVFNGGIIHIEKGAQLWTVAVCRVNRQEESDIVTGLQDAACLTHRPGNVCVCGAFSGGMNRL
jgi:Tfp pilus assembly protein PilV